MGAIDLLILLADLLVHGARSTKVVKDMICFDIFLHEPHPDSTTYPVSSCLHPNNHIYVSDPMMILVRSVP